jgi:predicted enzyme related to lactoylglutathione lyase
MSNDKGPRYVTLHVRDLARAESFFGQLFGWKFHPGNVKDGAIVENTGVPTGLHGGADEPRAALYFAVADFVAGVEAVRAAGGSVRMLERDKSWWITQCADNQGTEFSLMGPMKRATVGA